MKKICFSSGQLHLPPERSCPSSFLQQCLNGTKKLLHNDHVGSDVVPNYRELSVKVLMNEFKEDHEVISHLPDSDSMARPIPRKFLHEILFSLRGEYMRHIV